MYSVNGNPQVTSGSPTQRASNVESVSMSQNHHVPIILQWGFHSLALGQLYIGPQCEWIDLWRIWVTKGHEKRKILNKIQLKNILFPSQFYMMSLFKPVDTYMSGLILSLCPANERWCYFVTTSLISWVQTWNQSCMREWTPSSLVQIMAWCLFNTKPLSEPMLIYHQLDIEKQILVKY